MSKNGLRKIVLKPVIKNWRGAMRKRLVKKIDLPKNSPFGTGDFIKLGLSGRVDTLQEFNEDNSQNDWAWFPADKHALYVLHEVNGGAVVGHGKWYLLRDRKGVEKYFYLSFEPAALTTVCLDELPTGIIKRLQTEIAR